MTNFLAAALIIICIGAVFAADSKITLVIHGGAGTILREEMTPEKEKDYRAALELALKTGYDVLKKGGSALDAVEASVRILEDSPLFNAGKGSVFNADGKIEMDAAIMDGRTLKAGAVAAVTNIKNPITAARAVMEKSGHVLLIGPGAEQFAAAQGLDIVDPSYFHTDFRYQQLLKEKAKEKQQPPQTAPQTQEKHLGTVGALALDAAGNLAAATSTGGRTNKRFGRVGDTPIIGAGTYANNSTCAVSGTGYGEYFLRTVASFKISALMQYKNLTAKEAAQSVMNEIKALGGDGGVIVLDHQGNHAFVFNTAGMYRGAITADGKALIEIFK
jgi:beta-aspartyl-peptidase (threonine type)